MPKAHFDIYRAQVFELAKTMAIKSLATAYTINDELKMLGYQVDEVDPTTWKYYQNLAGRYHTLDTVMTVTSLDTLQTIEFTVENLQVHRATADAYVYGSRYYKELISRYPNQESLILGILNPVDIATAIAADDGTILYYNPDLVESNETNLIPQLQEWISGVFARWHVSAYQLTDDLYVPSFLMMLYNFIPIAVMNLRNANCHTRFAHSFHIREFLASHGKLHHFIDYLTKTQMLWLYRNIRYIHRNAGKQDTMDWLVENILTARGLPLAEWKMTHNLADMPDAELYPKVEFTRTPLNFGRHLAGRDHKTIEEMLDDEQPIARGNIRVQDDAEIEIRRQMETSIRNSYMTKVLESAIIDLTDAKPFTFASFILNHWLYLSNIGRYNSFINFDDPRTGAPVTLSTKDAFVVFLFALNKRYGVTLTQIPTIEADLVRKIPMPTRSQIRNLTEREYVTDEILDAYYSVLSPIGTYISIAGFREAMRKEYDGLMKQWFVWSQLENYMQRGQAEVAGLYFYQDISCNLGNEGSYEDWFSDLSLEYWDYNALECEILSDTILKKAIGADLHEEISLAEMQAALLRLMGRLSSYTVQYLQDINTSPVRILNWNAVRVGDVDEGVEAHDVAPVIVVTIVKAMEEARRLNRLSIYDLGSAVKMSTRSLSKEHFPLQLVIGDSHLKEIRYRFFVPSIKIRNVVHEFDDFTADTPIRDTPLYVPRSYVELDEAFLSFESEHYTLTPSDRSSIHLRWDAYLADPSIADPMSGNLTVTTLDGINDSVVGSLIVNTLDGFEL